MENGGAEELLALEEDLLGGGSGVRGRSVVERGHFRKKGLIFLNRLGES